MSFQDELDKLTRMRRAYLRFAKEFNPLGAWTGSEDRRYGKTPDPTGAVPVSGTVESFGTFRNALANHRFTLEIPSVQSTLFDPVNEWRALADRPSHLLLNKRIGYYLRQLDDNDEVLDQLIALGQVSTPAFPPGKVRLDLKVPGGDFLGEDVGRRLVTTRDWPRAHPDVLGKVVPFVYGQLSNTPGATTIAGAGLPTCGVAAGSFLKDTGTGEQTISGLDFEPKAIIFFSDNSTAFSVSAQMEVMNGFSDGTSHYARHNIYSDSTAAENVSQNISDEYCVWFVDEDETEVAGATCQLLTGGFILNWVVNDGRPSIIHYLAIGGTNVQAYASHATGPTSSTTQTVTGVPFTPSVFLTLGGFNSFTTTDFGSGQGIGLADGTNNAVCTFYSKADSNPTLTKRKSRTTKCLSVNQVLDPSSIPPIEPCSEASLTGFTTDGFTLSWTYASCGAIVYPYLVLSGIVAEVGSLTQPTTAGTQQLTTGFVPLALLFQSFGAAADSAAGGIAECQYSIGVAVTGYQGSIWGGAANNVSPTRSARRSRSDALLQCATVTGSGGAATINADVLFSAFTSAGPLLNWATVDGTARQILYLALGCPEATGSGDCTERDFADAEIANPGGYTVTGASTMVDALSDPPVSDATYVESPSEPDEAVAVVRLTGVTLQAGAAASVRVRAGTSDFDGVPIALTVELRQGYTNESSQGTLIASWTQANIAPGSFALYTFTVSAEQVATITSPNDLYIRWSMSAAEEQFLDLPTLASGTVVRTPTIS